jgi:hypothetical protein
MKIILILIGILTVSYLISACAFITPDDERNWHPTLTWHDYVPPTSSDDTIKNNP